MLKYLSVARLIFLAQKFLAQLMLNTSRNV